MHSSPVDRGLKHLASVQRCRKQVKDFGVLLPLRCKRPTWCSIPKLEISQLFFRAYILEDLVYLSKGVKLIFYSQIENGSYISAKSLVTSRILKQPLMAILLFL